MSIRRGKPHVVQATILFIDLMNSVALSNTLSLQEYNDLLNDYQEVLREVILSIHQWKNNHYHVAEWYLQGDQLAVFFYNPEDADVLQKIESLRKRNPASKRANELELALNRQSERCLYGALRCAVQVKNSWIAHSRNIGRVESQQPVLDVGVGINVGHVIYQQRADGQHRVEGFAINFAKRVEGFSRYGNYCKIMVSKIAHETFTSTVVGHTMLKQRAFFEKYVPQTGTLKGLAPGTMIYELKFFHRLAGFGISADQVSLFTKIFNMDATNIWAYSNLLDYLLYKEKNYDAALKLAQRALYANPDSEKVCYDLARINRSRNELFTAEQYCHRCISINNTVDNAYELLAEIELLRNRNWQRVLDYRTKVLALAPGSAASHVQVAIAFANLKLVSDAKRHLKIAQKIYPHSLQLITDSDYYTDPEKQRLFKLDGKHSRSSTGTA